MPQTWRPRCQHSSTVTRIDQTETILPCGGFIQVLKVFRTTRLTDAVSGSRHDPHSLHSVSHCPIALFPGISFLASSRIVSSTALPSGSDDPIRLSSLKPSTNVRRSIPYGYLYRQHFCDTCNSGLSVLAVHCILLCPNKRSDV